ncbi:MAG TPA: nucleotidyltransferase family protein [Thermoleophilia bacterium]|nr:nucleotidyltransferase family protein [Thermoleophilia bacterium]HQG03244.1 nucleotidyltransferase family protein [Thermoleophilia bacterium]HQG54274.1 nucleotidyltransferase family protein [Thermoleophilia bacterium]HQJ97264.1 nucleotidyltransferase family protein [Thermoleophilia bacterium]
MTRRETIRRLQRHTSQIKRFGVRHLSIFGSTARDEATEHSDTDILVEFDPHVHIGLFGFVELQRVLEEALSSRIDLATPDALRPEMRAEILSEAVRVF